MVGLGLAVGRRSESAGGVEVAVEGIERCWVVEAVLEDLEEERIVFVEEVTWTAVVQDGTVAGSGVECMGVELGGPGVKLSDFELGTEVAGFLDTEQESCWEVGVSFGEVGMLDVVLEAERLAEEVLSVVGWLRPCLRTWRRRGLSLWRR